MVSHDVQFTVNSGDYEGSIYRYMLATKDGAKQWNVTPLFEPPPSTIKEKIEMVILVQDKNIPMTAAIELATANKIIGELRILAEDLATLVGADKQARLVQIDENGYKIELVVNEATREPEYIINLTCWGIYDIT